MAAAAAALALLVGCGGDEGTASVATDTSSAAETSSTSEPKGSALRYPNVQTNQTSCYDDSVEIDCPAEGEPFYGQDATYEAGSPVDYTDNGDGTVTDNSTGLMWQQDPGEKQSYGEIAAGADSFELAGYDDWRLPTIKELYSLILFNGTDVDPAATDTSELTPFIDADVFAFSYGDTAVGDRVIDSQWATSSIYESTVFDGQECFFGVNFADGRIKCYPTSGMGSYYGIYVRDTGSYGDNDFTDNGDGTVTDAATGLTWQQDDNGEGVDWESALAYCEELELGGADDWRLPNAKELQSIADYSRSPDSTDSAALDPVFEITEIENELGEKDFGFFWASTTHLAYPDNATEGVYVSFGRATGYMNGQWLDVHGAGAQRSDPKTGSAEDFPSGRGPQGDAIRIENFVRCVRGGLS